MKKRLSLVVLFSVLLASSITVAVFAQAQTNDLSQTSDASTNVVDYIDAGGNVILTVPNGSISHPLNLRILTEKINSSSDFGALNLMEIQIWHPTLNMYVNVAIIETNTNPEAIAWSKNLLNGTPIWTPPLMQNYFTPSEEELQMYTEGDIFWVNLTTPVNVTLPVVLGGNFTVPPMTLMFVPIGESFPHQETIVLPKPNYSGWTIVNSHIDTPAWVRTEIPMWVTNAAIENVGTMITDGTMVYIPPTE